MSGQHANNNNNNNNNTKDGGNAYCVVDIPRPGCDVTNRDVPGEIIDLLPRGPNGNGGGGSEKIGGGGRRSDGDDDDHDDDDDVDDRKDGGDDDRLSDDARLTWDKKTEYILSGIGYCVGLGNVWRFPYVCIRNGGGAFLVPFFLCLTLCAMPLFFLEASIGQYSGLGPYGVWNGICPLFKGIGIAMNILCLMVIWYYSMILGWSLIYLVNSFKAVLPWTLCGQDWNTDQCVTRDSSKVVSNQSTSVVSVVNMTMTIGPEYLVWINLTGNESLTVNETSVWSFENRSSAINVTTSSSEEFWLYNVLDISSGLDDMGSVPWHTTTALFISNLCILLGVIRGIKSSGKAVYVTATLPYLLLTLLIIRGCFLPGAMDGLAFYVMPDLGKFFRLQTWLEAAIQVFYSLGPTYGCIITMSSYNRFHNNCIRDSILLAFACEGTSVFAGFAIFSVLGHMAYTVDVPVGNFSSSGAGLAFIVYPQAIALLPLPQLWGILFFLMLFSLGLDTQFCNVETIMTTCADAWPRVVTRYRTPLTCLLVVVVSLSSIPFAARGGMYVFQLVDWYIAAFSILFIGALECLVVSWIYGIERIFTDIQTMTGRRPHVFFSLAWKFITPILLLCVLAGTLSTYEDPKYGNYQYTSWGLFLGWSFAVVSFLPIPACALWQIYHGTGSIRERVTSACQPSDKWRPSLKGTQDCESVGGDGGMAKDCNSIPL